MNKQPVKIVKRPRDDKVISNIIVDSDGGVQLDLSNPETTNKLFDIIDAFRKARPTPSTQK